MAHNDRQNPPAKNHFLIFGNKKMSVPLSCKECLAGPGQLCVCVPPNHVDCDDELSPKQVYDREKRLNNMTLGKARAVYRRHKRNYQLKIARTYRHGQLIRKSAAVKIQKIYRGYRTRGILGDIPKNAINQLYCYCGRRFCRKLECRLS